MRYGLTFLISVWGYETDNFDVLHEAISFAWVEIVWDRDFAARRRHYDQDFAFEIYQNEQNFRLLSHFGDGSFPTVCKSLCIQGQCCSSRRGSRL